MRAIHEKREREALLRVEALETNALGNLDRFRARDRHWTRTASGAGRGSAPAVVKAAPRADLAKVFLMGHSRGGEGVNRAAMDSLTPPPAAQVPVLGNGAPKLNSYI